MPVSISNVDGWFDKILKIPGVFIEPSYLYQDLFNIASQVGDDIQFDGVMSRVYDVLEKLRDGRLSTSKLKGAFSGWESHHFQSVRRQGQKADMRVIHRRVGGGIRVKVIGFRHYPVDVYSKLRQRLRP